MLKYILFAVLMLEGIVSIFAVKYYCGKNTNPESGIFNSVWRAKETNIIFHIHYSWMVRIINENGLYQYGSLIHPKVALAEGRPRRINRWDTVVAGRFDVDEGNQSFHRQTQIVWSTHSLGNIIQILVFKEPFVLNEHVNTVCLPNPTDKPYGRKCDHFVFNGKYENNAGFRWTRFTEKIVTYEICKYEAEKYYPGKVEFDENNICAIHEYTNPDYSVISGSPLACPLPEQEKRHVLFGVETWNIGINPPANRAFFGVFANIAKLREWIDKTMGELGFDTSFYELENEIISQTTDMELPPDTIPGNCGKNNLDGVESRIVDTKKKRSCGGSLIHPWVILTAAQCVYRKNISNLQVYAGPGIKKLPKPQAQKISFINVHEEYNKNDQHNDFALVVLEEPVGSIKNITTACLPYPNDKFDNMDCFINGWIETDKYDNPTTMMSLNQVKLPTYSHHDCKTSLMKEMAQFEFNQSQICAGNEMKKKTCSANKGTPLVCPDPKAKGRYVQVGLFSGADKCGLKIPGVYGNIAVARKWIDKEMAKLGFDISTYISH